MTDLASPRGSPCDSDVPRREVLAAGALCWRRGPQGTEVLLVHRPKYDDWSFPKGKLEDGELAAVCAVREVAEETGVVVRLGRPLPQVTYTDQNGAPKRVTYWAATPVHHGARTAPQTEIDQVAWVPLSQAGDRLTAPGDKSPLDALRRHAETHQLDTAPVGIVRHATARPRDSWARADADRPLVDRGRRQADALAPLLDCWRPESVVSSPWRRCLETLHPYVAHRDIRVRTKQGLSERGFRRNPGKAVKHLTRLIERARPAILCTHRPVLQGVLGTLRRFTAVDAAAAVPTEDPYLAPCEVLVAHVRRDGAGPRVVAVERHTVPT